MEYRSSGSEWPDPDDVTQIRQAPVGLCVPRGHGSHLDRRWSGRRRLRRRFCCFRAVVARSAGASQALAPASAASQSSPPSKQHSGGPARLLGLRTRRRSRRVPRSGRDRHEGDPDDHHRRHVVRHNLHSDDRLLDRLQRSRQDDRGLAVAVGEEVDFGSPGWSPNANGSGTRAVASVEIVQPHVLGKVTSMSGSQLVVTQQDGLNVTVNTSTSTTYGEAGTVGAGHRRRGRHGRLRHGDSVSSDHDQIDATTIEIVLPTVVGRVTEVSGTTITITPALAGPWRP